MCGGELEVKPHLTQQASQCSRAPWFPHTAGDSKAMPEDAGPLALQLPPWLSLIWQVWPSDSLPQLPGAHHLDFLDFPILSP